MRVLIATALLLFVTDERAPVTGFFDLPVTGGTATYEMLGLQAEERGAAIALLAREMFAQSSGALERAAAVRNFVGQVSQPGKEKEIAADTRPITIAVPLTADHWRDVLQLNDKADLFASLINNRPAMLVCAGAMSADPSIRALLEHDRGLLKWIVKNAPAAFWASSRSLRIDKDRVIVPGGAAMEPMWEALVAIKVTRPADFLRAMLTKDSGRLAWFYDAVASMSDTRRALALSGGLEPMYAAFRSSDSNWKIEDHPFLRGTTDPVIVSSLIDLAGDDVAPPAEQWFWDALLDRNDITRRMAVTVKREPAAKVTLAWLTQKISGSNARERRDRFEMVRFAQGVFPKLEDDAVLDAFVALGGYRRYRGLLLTLDRIGVTSPRVYARAVEAARQLNESLSGRDEKHAVIAFQAALAIIERACLTNGISEPAAETLILSLADLVDPAGAGNDAAKPPARPFPLLKEWIVTTLFNAVPPLVKPDQFTTGATAYESRFLQALAGPPSDPNAPTLTWEGLDYRVDLFSSEHARLKRIREQIESPGLDAAIASDDAEKISNALLALIYTPALGDPEGPALLGVDIAQRHNFGLVGPAGMRRDYLAWSLPREQVGDGSPWHVEGSIMGLDIALARLSLRRIADNEMPIAPTINLNDQLTFARTVMTLNPRALRDEDRDRIVEAIARGRERIAAAKDLKSVSALAAEARLSASVRQTLPWLMTRTPGAAPALFGLRDMLWLGKPGLDRATLDAWGVYAEGLNNRLRTAMPLPAPWEDFGGRADGGLIATQAPDLILRMAEETAHLELPAQLVPALLGFAAMDYWHDVESRFPDDWPAITRQALALSSSRVEDYVAALAGAGPLRPQ